MIIDVHSHIYPRQYVERLKRRRTIPRVEEVDGQEFFIIFAPEESGRTEGGPPGRPLDASYYEITTKLSWMDAHGISHSVISLGNPWYDFLPAEEAPAFARQTNDLLLDLVRRWPDRLSCYAALPLQDLGAALTELDRVAEAGVKGIILSTRPGGLRLDDHALWPLYERLERLGLPVLLHPHYTLGADELDGYDHALPLVFGFPFETTVALARLILSGALDTFPRLRLIAAHLGGTLPYLAGRLDVWYRSVGGRSLRQPPSRYLTGFFYDTLAYHAPAITCALRLVGPGCLLFGSDHPFGIADVDAVRASLTAQGLSSEDYGRIGARNARTLFGVQA
ncbi:MAG: amidohydrolase family protein [Armatimonadota bacterium]